MGQNEERERGGKIDREVESEFIYAAKAKVSFNPEI